MKTYKIYYREKGIESRTMEIMAIDLFELFKRIHRTMEISNIETIYKIFVI